MEGEWRGKDASRQPLDCKQSKRASLWREVEQGQGKTLADNHMNINKASAHHTHITDINNNDDSNNHNIIIIVI